MCTAGPLRGDTTKRPWGPGVTFAAGRATSFRALPSWSASQTSAGRIRSSANVSRPDLWWVSRGKTVWLWYEAFHRGSFQASWFLFYSRGVCASFWGRVRCPLWWRGEGMDKRLFPVQVPCSVNIGFQRVAGDLEANKTLQGLVRIPQR